MCRDVFPAFASHAQVKPVHLAMIDKRETPLRDAFWTYFKRWHPMPPYGVLQLQDVRKSGRPDSVLNLYKKTSWWEFKHATPHFTSQTLQELTCLWLAKHSFCRYIIFFEYDTRLSILIAHPSAVFGQHGKLDNITIEHEIDGHNFKALANYVYRSHMQS